MSVLKRFDCKGPRQYFKRLFKQRIWTLQTLWKTVGLTNLKKKPAILQAASIFPSLSIHTFFWIYCVIYSQSFLLYSELLFLCFTKSHITQFGGSSLCLIFDIFHVTDFESDIPFSLYQPDWKDPLNTLGLYVSLCPRRNLTSVPQGPYTNRCYFIVNVLYLPFASPKAIYH